MDVKYQGTLVRPSMTLLELMQVKEAMILMHTGREYCVQIGDQTAANQLEGDHRKGEANADQVDASKMLIFD